MIMSDEFTLLHRLIASIDCIDDDDGDVIDHTFTSPSLYHGRMDIIVDSSAMSFDEMGGTSPDFAYFWEKSDDTPTPSMETFTRPYPMTLILHVPLAASDTL